MFNKVCVIDHSSTRINYTRAIGAEGERSILWDGDTMRPGSGWGGGMADGARIDRPVVALQLEELQAILVGQGAGRDGVSAVVTSLAVSAAVPE